MPTLSQALTTFLQIERRPATNHQYQVVLSRMMLAVGMDRDVSRITFEDLLEYQTALRQRVQPSTVYGYIGVIKTFFTWCLKRRYIEADPTVDLVRRRPVANTVNRAIPPEELARMVEYARVTSPRNHALMLFLADTGCRVGGLVSLTLLNTHLDEGFAFLLEKGGRWHKARFGEETAAALEYWISKRPAVSHDFMWTGRGPDYAPIKRQAVEVVVAKLGELTGATCDPTPHKIRHGVGHAYARAGIPAPVTQRKLGHSHISTTLNHYYPNMDSEVDVISRQMPLAALKAADELRPLAAPVSPLKRRKNG